MRRKRTAGGHSRPTWLESNKQLVESHVPGDADRGLRKVRCRKPKHDLDRLSGPTWSRVPTRDTCMQAAKEAGHAALMARFVTANELTKRPPATRETYANASQRDIWSLSKPSTIGRQATASVHQARARVSAQLQGRLRPRSHVVVCRSEIGGNCQQHDERFTFYSAAWAEVTAWWPQTDYILRTRRADVRTLRLVDGLKSIVTKS